MSYFATHAFFLLFLGKITALGIDEDGYLWVFQNVYDSEFDIKTQLSWPTDSKFLLQLIYLPAKTISLLGVPDFLSIRLQSTILFYYTCRIIFKQIQAVHNGLNLTLLILFIFSPSIFVWTSLGLRESYIFFWITIIWFATHKLLEDSSRSYLLLLALGVNGLATTKIYLFVQVLIMGTVTMVFFIKSKGFKTSIIHLFVLLSPVYLLPGIQGEIKSSAQSAFLIETAPNSDGGASTRKGEGVPQENIDQESKVNRKGPIISQPKTNESEIYAGLTLKLLLVQIEENALLKTILTKSGVLGHLNSVVTDRGTVRNDNVKNNKFENGSLTNIGQLFLAVMKFLILPIPLAENGSFLINLQSLESPILYFSYLILLWVLYKVVKNKTPRSHLFYGLFSFACIFIVQSALIEVNLGTLVRHRSILSLIIVLACVEASSKISVSRANQVSVNSRNLK